MLLYDLIFFSIPAIDFPPHIASTIGVAQTIFAPAKPSTPKNADAGVSRIIGCICIKVPNPPHDLAMFEARLNGQVTAA